MKPLVTVAVPSFNQGRYLNEALASIFAQNVPIEVFVMDGGSTDQSVDTIRQWESKLAIWRSRPDEGQAAAINEGISLGSAPYVCWLNSDDYFYTDGLGKLVQALESSVASPFVYGHCWTVSEQGRKLSPYLTVKFSPRLFANFCFVAQPATLIRRSAWEKLAGLNETMQMAFDYDLWWRLFRSFSKPAYCRSFIAATRMHRESKTARHKELHYQESIDVISRNCGHVPLKWRVLHPLIKMTRKTGK